jgi:hypothetical protein
MGDGSNAVAAALVAIGVTACGPAADEDGGVPAVSVTVSAGGTECIIAAQTMPCDRVAVYLRDVAKVKFDKRVEVTGDPTNTRWQHFDAVVRSISDVGYTFVQPTFYVDGQPST